MKTTNSNSFKSPIKKNNNFRNFFVGSSYDIYDQAEKHKDPIKFITLISFIFAIIFFIIFRTFNGFINDIALTFVNIFSFSSLINILLFIGFILILSLCIFGIIFAQRRKTFIVGDAIGLFGLYLYAIFFVTYSINFNVTINNVLWYLVCSLPSFFALFSLGVFSFRFFLKLFTSKKNVSILKVENYNRIVNKAKRVFPRFGNYFKHNWGQILIVIALISLAVAVLYPLIVLIFRSLNDPIEDLKHPFDVPTIFTFGNYKEIWGNIKGAFVNSLVTTIGVTFGTLICASLLAYAFIRFNFRFKNILFYLIIGLMMIPGILTLISRYQLIQQMGLIDDGYQDIFSRMKIYLGIILPGIAGYIPMAFMLLFTFFKGIPHDLLEAADVDGASNFGVFFKVVIPLSKPILSTIAIQTFVGEWNDYLWANLVIGNDGNAMTLPVILQFLSKSAEQGTMYYSTVFAGYVLSAIPLVLIFIVASKQFIEGLTSGAFKM